EFPAPEARRSDDSTPWRSVASSDWRTAFGAAIPSKFQAAPARTSRITRHGEWRQAVPWQSCQRARDRRRGCSSRIPLAQRKLRRGRHEKECASSRGTGWPEHGGVSVKDHERRLTRGRAYGRLAHLRQRALLPPLAGRDAKVGAGRKLGGSAQDSEESTNVVVRRGG